MQKITPFLWFDGQAEEAANFYVSVFKNSKIGTVSRYGPDAAKATGRPAGSVMTVAFELDGQKFVGLNGGPVFKFTPAVSFVANCETQEEVDRLWGQLADGGATGQCGWLTDRYGVSWQVVPTVLEKLMKGGDAAASSRMMSALLQMTKLDIVKLQQAYDHK